MRVLACAIALATALFFATPAAAAPSVDPYHVRLSLSGNADGSEMVVGWTVNGTYTAESYVPYVVYQRDTETEEWEHSVDCIHKAYLDTQTHFYCTIKSLWHNTDYTYMVAGLMGQSISDFFHFRAQPAAGQSTKIAVLGDLGYELGEPTARVMAAEVARKAYALVVHVGDLAYADGYDHDGPNVEYDAWTDKFMALIAPTTSGAPYMICPGNRDVTCHFDGDHDCLASTRNFTAYINRWQMPSRATGGPGDSGMWYTYAHGDVQFISINTESNYPGAPYNAKTPASAGEFWAPQEQMVWLDEQLRRANTPAARKLRPWVVVIGHRPLYSTLTLDFPANHIKTMRAVFERLFTVHGVDLYISGHAHMYERSYPISEFDFQPFYGNVSFPVQIVNGAAGNVEAHCHDVTAELPDYIPYRNTKQYGYGVITTRKPGESGHAASLRRAAAPAAVGDVKRVERADGTAWVGPVSSNAAAGTTRPQHRLSQMSAEAKAKRAADAAAAKTSEEEVATASAGGVPKVTLCYEFLATTKDQGPNMSAVDEFCLTRDI
jgi:hypothetical protein